MEMMKAVVYEKPGDGRLTELPIPKAGDNEVVIKVMAAAICKGADRRHQTTGHALGRYPITTGHEFAGVVYEVGKDVTTCKPGERVTADNGVFCGECYYCRHEYPMMCENVGAIGHSIPGGFAQYLKSPAANVIHLPDNISFDEGALMEPVACCMHAMERLDVKYGENVLVYGAGPNGIILGQLIHHSNANQVVVMASTQSKLDLLEGYGIKTVLIDRDDPAKHKKIVNELFPRGVNAIVDATGTAKILEDAIPFLAKGGRLLQYSSPPDDDTITINPAYFYRNELTYYTSFCQAYKFPQAAAAMASGKVKVDKMITKIYRLDDFFTAIEDVLDRNVLKLILHPNG